MTDVIVLTAATTVTIACLAIFFIAGLMFSRSMSRALAFIAAIATFSAYLADHSGPAIAVTIFCALATLLFAIISWAAGEN